MPPARAHSFAARPRLYMYAQFFRTTRTIVFTQRVAQHHHPYAAVNPCPRVFTSTSTISPTAKPVLIKSPFSRNPAPVENAMLFGKDDTGNPCGSTERHAAKISKLNVRYLPKSIFTIAPEVIKAQSIVTAFGCPKSFPTEATSGSNITAATVDDMKLAYKLYPR